MDTANTTETSRRLMTTTPVWSGAAQHTLV